MPKTIIAYGELHDYLAGASLHECCQQANHLAAAVARTRGGMKPVVF